MRPNYRFLIIVSFLMSCLAATSQQLGRRTQFATNTFLVNPAAAGTQNYAPIYATFRNQWAGFNGAPTTMNLSGHTGLAKGFGAGAVFYKDDTGGAISRTGAELTGAYKVDLTNFDVISFGLSLGANQFTFDNSKLNVFDRNDNALNDFQAETSTNVDATFGMLVYGKQYFFGFSVPQLIQTRLNLQSAVDGDSNRNQRHFQLMGSYRHYLNDVLDIQPGGFVRFTGNTPVQIDVNVRLNYLENGYAGFTYRHKDAVAFIVGGSFKGFALGYSYDLTTGAANAFSPHTHEVILGYLIPSNKGKFRATVLGGRVLDRSRVVN
jgi:type IX secretion system PorP/SprF family membrane protein